MSVMGGLVRCKSRPKVLNVRWACAWHHQSILIISLICVEQRFGEPPLTRAFSLLPGLVRARQAPGARLRETLKFADLPWRARGDRREPARLIGD